MQHPTQTADCAAARHKAGSLPDCLPACRCVVGAVSVQEAEEAASLEEIQSIQLTRSKLEAWHNEVRAAASTRGTRAALGRSVVIAPKVSCLHAHGGGFLPSCKVSKAAMLGAPCPALYVPGLSGGCRSLPSVCVVCHGFTEGSPHPGLNSPCVRAWSVLLQPFFETDLPGCVLRIVPNLGPNAPRTSQPQYMLVRVEGVVQRNSYA
jgi:hypothetical protein